MAPRANPKSKPKAQSKNSEGFKPGVRLNTKTSLALIFALRERMLIHQAVAREGEILKGWRSEAVQLIQELQVAQVAETRERTRRERREKALTDDSGRFARDRASERAHLKELEAKLEVWLGFAKERDASDDETLDPSAISASLNGVTSGLADQLTSITEEMNKIRQELYGESGIGGIASELAKIKAGGSDLEMLLNRELPTTRPASTSTATASGTQGSSGPRKTAAAQRPTESRAISSEAQSESRQRLSNEERERRIEELRQKLKHRKHQQLEKEKSKPNPYAAVGELLVVVFVLFMFAYVISSDFKTFVKKAFHELVLGQAYPSQDEEQYGAIVQDDTEPNFF